MKSRNAQGMRVRARWASKYRAMVTLLSTETRRRDSTDEMEEFRLGARS